MRRLILTFVLIFSAGLATAQTLPTNLGRDTLSSGGANVLVAPHGFCVLPDGRPLNHERAGKIKLFVYGQLTAVGPVPKLRTGYERGLISVAADPNFQVMITFVAGCRGKE